MPECALRKATETSTAFAAPGKSPFAERQKIFKFRSGPGPFEADHIKSQSMPDTNAFIKGFDYDIFISYAHVDNTPLAGQKAGWIEQFHEELNILLSRRIGRTGAVKIWWDDNRLNGNTLFDHSIKDGIQRSAIFLCLMSYGYMQSDYCQKELNLFYTKAQNEPVGISVGAQSRILTLLLNNLPHTKWPQPLHGAEGFPFYDSGGNDPLDITDVQCKAQLKNFRNALVELVLNFPQPAETVTPLSPIVADKAAAENSGAFTIFFGDVPDTLRTLRKRTITELEKAGYAIVTDVPPPSEAAAHEKIATEKIAAADLSVHLLDQYPGREIEGAAGIWYPQKQAEIGLKGSKASLVWTPADMALDDVEEEAYKRFLQNLESGKQAAKNYDYIRGIKGELPQQITTLAERLKAQQKPPQKAGKLAVLLDVHVEDQKYAWKLGSTLWEHEIEPILNPQEDSPVETNSLLSERIGQANKLVFFYGKVQWTWVQRRITAAMKLIINNNYPADEFFVFLVPPHKNPADIAFGKSYLRLNVINNSDFADINQDSLQQFLQTVNAVA